MKCSKLLLITVLAVLAGCIQAIDMYSIRDIDSIPQMEYTAYLYSSGEGEVLRAVFLKNPDSGIEVVPYSIQIATAKGTPADALKFMERGSSAGQIECQGVTYKGKPIGYLLTRRYYGFSSESIEINLYEREGKVYFSVSEKKHDD